MSHVDVTVMNPQDLTRSWVGRFVVDTGAFNTLVPRRHPEAIGIQPDRLRAFEMADETPAPATSLSRGPTSRVSMARTLVFGEGEVEPLLRVAALEPAGMVVDPRTQQLRRLPILPLQASVFPELVGAAA